MRWQVRVLDDVLKSAKLRSADPKKYLPLAVDMLQDRLQQSATVRQRKQTVRFAHTIETLFTATDNEPGLINSMLKKEPEGSVAHAEKDRDELSVSSDADESDRARGPDGLEAGLTVGQLAAMLAGQEPMKLTRAQIEQ